MAKCSVPLTVLTEIWKPLPLTYRLKNKEDGAVQILELSRDATNNVVSKTTSDITLGCPMDFAKFPFDQQSCKFEMILDEVLNGNLTIYTGAVMFTDQGEASNKKNWDFMAFPRNPGSPPPSP